MNRRATADIPDHTFNVEDNATPFLQVIVNTFDRQFPSDRWNSGCAHLFFNRTTNHVITRQQNNTLIREEDQFIHPMNTKNNKKSQTFRSKPSLANIRRLSLHQMQSQKSVLIHHCGVLHSLFNSSHDAPKIVKCLRSFKLLLAILLMIALQILAFFRQYFELAPRPLHQMAALIDRSQVLLHIEQRLLDEGQSRIERGTVKVHERLVMNGQRGEFLFHQINQFFNFVDVARIDVDREFVLDAALMLRSQQTIE